MRDYQIKQINSMVYNGSPFNKPAVNLPYICNIWPALRHSEIQYLMNNVTFGGDIALSLIDARIHVTTHQGHFRQ